MRKKNSTMISVVFLKELWEVFSYFFLKNLAHLSFRVGEGIVSI
jgi:hypothetical protein